jgi:YD repeat-containing protein
VAGVDDSTPGNPLISTGGTAGLMAQTNTFYDDQGEVYRTTVENIAPTTWTDSGSLETDDVHNVLGETIETISPTGLTTVDAYDGLGRVTEQTVQDSPEEDADPIQDVKTQYDADGNVIFATTRSYFSQGGGSITDYAAVYYDRAGRTIETADFGDNNGETLSDPPAMPGSNDGSALITQYLYSSNGQVEVVTDPNGNQTLYSYDALGRRENVDVRSGETLAIVNSTENTFDGMNHLVSTTASVDDGPQITTYRYGGEIQNSKDQWIYSNDLLAEMLLPDPSTGSSVIPSSPIYSVNVVNYQYNLAGQLISEKGRDGITHVYGYNALGWQTSDTAAAFPRTGTGGTPYVIDTTLQKIVTTYNALGEATAILSFDGTIADASKNSEVDQAFNGLGQVTSQRTQGSIQITATTYGWADNTTTYDYNSLGQLTDMVYPDNYKVTYNYSNLADAALGRPTSESDDVMTLASFDYLGSSSQVMDQADTQAGINLEVTLDQFGRVAEQNWTGPGSGSPAELSDTQYIYDADGNVLFQADLVNPSLGGTYTYNTLNQVTEYKRGGVTITDGFGSLSGSASVDQVLTWNAQGALLTNTVNGTSVLDNSSDAQNQNTNDGFSASGDTASFTNAAGSGVQAVYDAWGRPVKYTVTQSTGGTNDIQTETIQYDALAAR